MSPETRFERAIGRDDLPTPAGGTLPSRPIPAWVMSGILHSVLFLALAVGVRSAPRGAAVEPERTAGIVLAQPSRDEPTYLTEEDFASGGNASTPSPGVPTSGNPLPSPSEIPMDLAGILPSGKELVGLTGGTGDGLPGADGFLTGPRPGRFTGGKVQTGVFGVQGVGSTFVYVFDRSKSMSGYEGRPLSAAKAELIHSLQSLQATHQFQIVFYNERPSVFNPLPGRQPQMIFGTDQDKELAVDFIRRVAADGGTRHLDALKLAVNMGPDVIFFLTDADEPRLTEDELALIRRWNRAEASINTIQFGAGPYDGEDNFLVRLAERNNGRHVYVDVTKLPRGR